MGLKLPPGLQKEMAAKAKLSMLKVA
jgi:hypothetical protein